MTPGGPGMVHVSPSFGMRLHMSSKGCDSSPCGHTVATRRECDLCIRRLVVDTSVKWMDSSHTVSLRATMAGPGNCILGENCELEASGRLQGNPWLEIHLRGWWEMGAGSRGA